MHFPEEVRGSWTGQKLFVDAPSQKANRFGHRFSVLRIEFEGTPLPSLNPQNGASSAAKKVGEAVQCVEVELRSTDLLATGDAGSYSVLFPQTSAELRERKLNNLMADRPDCIATANIGCQLHLAATAVVPVRHWLELLDDCLAGD